MTSLRAIQTFEVSLKAALFHDDCLLLVQEADTGCWELPGGRIDVGEERVPHADILAREIAEELGPPYQYVLHAEAITWVRQRPTDGVFQLLVARVALGSTREIGLSSEHKAFRWTVPDDWAALEFPPLSDYLDALRQIWKVRPVAA